MRFKAIQRVLGALIGMSSVIALPPFTIAWSLGEHTMAAFARSALASAVLGFALWWPVRRVNYQLRLRDGFFIVASTWWVVGLVAALPFVLTSPGLSYTDAVFEAVSGLTTTGATVIVGLDALPKSVLFYRQSLNFLGGMGIVILAVAILPMLKIGGTQLFRAESTGPTKDNKLTPRIADTAKALWSVYAALNALCALAYWLGGMSLFDAICHAMATLATGGFSTHDASFGYWDSTILDSIGTFFMIVGGVNFGLHWFAWRRATMKHYYGDAEFRTFLLAVLGVVSLSTIMLWFGGHFGDFSESLRHSAFQAVSVMTSTGFGTTGFGDWPGMIPLLLMFMACVGGCSGSTSGGMKMARAMILWRTARREVKQLVHPHGQFLVTLSGRRVSESVVITVAGFFIFYVVSVGALTLLMAASGLEFTDAFSAVVACINNMGPGLGEVNSNFSTVNDFGIWVSCFTMILGRLDVFTVLVLLSPSFWRD